MPRAPWPVCGSVGLLSRFTSAQSCSGNWTKRSKAFGSSNCRKNRLFLSVSPMAGAGILPTSRLSSARTGGIDLDPFARNLKEHAAEVVIEAVYLSAHPLKTPAQNSLEVIGVTRSASERMLAGLVPHSTKADAAAWI